MADREYDSVKNDLGGYEKTLTPMQRAKAAEALDKKFVQDGKVVTRREYIRKFVENGAETSQAEVYKLREPSKEDIFRMTDDQMRAYEKNRELTGKKAEYRISTPNGGYMPITKTEYDYANFLKSEFGRKPKEVPIQSDAG